MKFEELELTFGRHYDPIKIADALMEADEDVVIDGETGQTLTPFDEKYWEGVPV